MSHVVLLSPHHDDETLFAAFQILRVKPHVIICTRALVQEQRGYTYVRDGETLPITPLVRELETAAAMDVLGVEWEQWDIPDNQGGTLPPLGEKIKALADDYYFCIAPAFEPGGHDDHNLVALYAEQAFVSDGDDRLTRYLTYTRSNGRSRGGQSVEFEPSWPALKMRALACYESQIQHPSTRDHFMGDLWEWVV